MNLSSNWDKTEEAAVITAIPGYSENSSSGGRADNTAIPEVFDDWFQGDNRRSFPLDQSNAFGMKNLEEYDRQFPNYRVKTAVEIGFDTDGQNISSFEVQMEEPSESSPITLEGGPGEPENPFRAKEQGNSYPDEYDFDGANNYLKSHQKGPKTAQKKVSVPNDNGDSVDGVRGSIIFGGSDEYLTRAKNLGITLRTIASLEGKDAALATYYASLPAFYAFVDFVFMADGTKVVRVWDASYYPAHALYVGGTRQDRTPFDEGEEWTRDLVSDAFIKFAQDSVTPGRTPFDNLLGDFAYKKLFNQGYGNHPAMEHTETGTVLSLDTVESNLSSPFFPS